jgi:ABC-2 type transport system permease protein
MSRLLKIAVREYLAFLRTAGFWLSLFLTPVGLGLALGAPVLLERASPPPRVAVIDLTGEGYGAAIERALGAPHAARPGAPVQAAAVPLALPLGPVRSAEEAGRRLRPYLGRSKDGADAPLAAAAIVHRDPGGVIVDVWNRSLADRYLRDVVRGAVAARMTALRLGALGVPASAIEQANALSPRMVEFSAAAGTRAALRDQLPAVAGFALGMLLWMMIFTSAGILLNSVIEEKSSRILEVLLASASAGEIMGGKILGVAAVTATVLAVWAGLGGGVLVATSPHLAHELLAVLIGRGLAVVFAVYLIGGYLLYAALFTAIGAHCETNREAQTLLAPIMMLTTIPVLFMSQALTRPDLPALAMLSWFPLFTPFLAPVRAASDPPLWQVLGTMAVTASAAAASLWISVRAFRAGALAGGRADGRSLFLRVFRPSAD